jgi:Anti-sigma factor NepR
MEIESPSVTVDTPPSNEPSKDLLIPLGDDPIVTGLKRLYDSVLEEPVPDEFMSLLLQIDQTLTISSAVSTPATSTPVDTKAATVPFPTSESQ